MQFAPINRDNTGMELWFHEGRFSRSALCILVDTLWICAERWPRRQAPRATFKLSGSGSGAAVRRQRDENFTGRALGVDTGRMRGQPGLACGYATFGRINRSSTDPGIISGIALFST